VPNELRDAAHLRHHIGGRLPAALTSAEPRSTCSELVDMTDLFNGGRVLLDMAGLVLSAT
jgi:hypothetical protein